MRDLENKVIYQIYPKSFKDTTGSGTGDIQGIVSKLDYLKDLGVDYIWLSPIAKSPQNDNGYDISDYYTIDPMFGSNQDYEDLIAKANEKGIKIMMDLVLNHTSSEHEWFKKALAKDEKYYDFYIFRDEPNNIGSFFGGTAWQYSEEVGQYYFRLFDKTQPDLNWENKEVRDAIYDMVNYWIEKGVEGFRLDVIDLIGKEPDKYITGKGPKFYTYLSELNQSTFQDKLLTVGECWGSTLEESYQMCHAKGLTQAFHFNHLTLTDSQGDKWMKKPIHLQQLAEVLSKWQNDYTGIEAIVMNNHDMPRLVSTWLDDDKYRKESAKLLITLFGLMKGNLYLYQGEEIGMTNAYMSDIKDYNDVETLNKYKELKDQKIDEKTIMDIIQKTSRDNARVPMSWSSDANAGFTSGKPWLKVNANYESVNVEKDLASEDSIYRFYQKILQFRKANYDKVSQEVTFTVEGDILKFTRGGLHCIANFSKYTIPMAKQKVSIGNYNEEQPNFLRPFEVCVFEC